MSQDYEILGITQELFNSQIYDVKKINLHESEKRDFYEKLIEYREDFLKNMHVNHVFNPFNEMILCSSFKKLYPQEYEVMALPVCETIVYAQVGDQKVYVAMLNMKMMDKDEIFNNIKSLNIF